MRSINLDCRHLNAWDPTICIMPVVIDRSTNLGFSVCGLMGSTNMWINEVYQYGLYICGSMGATYIDCQCMDGGSPPIWIVLWVDGGDQPKWTVRVWLHRVYWYWLYRCGGIGATNIEYFCVVMLWALLISAGFVDGVHQSEFCVVDGLNQPGCPCVDWESLLTWFAHGWSPTFWIVCVYGWVSCNLDCVCLCVQFNVENCAPL